MTFKLLNRARMSVASAPGTGVITLNSATPGFQTFAAAGISNGDTFSYVAENGMSWEIGVATYSSTGPTLTRTTINETSAGSTSPLALTSDAVVTATIRKQDVNQGALASLSDVSLSSPTNDQVLTYNGSAWVNDTPSGGGMGATWYGEKPPFAPPQASWFDFSESATTTIGTNYTNRGMYISAATGPGSTSWSFGRRSTSGWGSGWSVTARVRPGNLVNRAYVNAGIGVLDSAGKMQALIWGGSGVANPAAISLVNLNSVTSYNGSPSGNLSTDIPELLRITLSGSNLLFGASWDGGLTWEYITVSATSFLSDHAYVCVGGQNDFYTSNSFVADNYGVLVTYWDDPDYPASGHYGS